ncbi:MAG: hypothetical protein JWQ96_1185 [Segetibacter sp.]|nr:hypothetical protein [Segetibacter sp.]
MTTKILFSFFVMVVLAACNKDEYQSKPQLTVKSINTKTLSPNQTLRFTLEVTDAEGDIQDTIWVSEVVRNCSQSGFAAKYPVPTFTGTKNFKAEIDVCFSYCSQCECPIITGPRCLNRNDSAVFRFALKDKAGNISDTISSETVVITR